MKASRMSHSRVFSSPRFATAFPARWRSVILLGLSALLGLATDPSYAALHITCSASDATLNFGSYAELSDSVSDGAGSFTVTCSENGGGGVGNVSVTYTATLTPTISPRQMTNGSDNLLYDIYTDSARTTRWGDGAGGTAAISGSFSLPIHGTATTPPISFYGRIPLVNGVGQNVSGSPSPQNYINALTINVTCTVVAGAPC